MTTRRIGISSRRWSRQCALYCACRTAFSTSSSAYTPRCSTWILAASILAVSLSANASPDSSRRRGDGSRCRRGRRAPLPSALVVLAEPRVEMPSILACGARSRPRPVPRSSARGRRARWPRAGCDRRSPEPLRSATTKSAGLPPLATHAWTPRCARRRVWGDERGARARRQTRRRRPSRRRTCLSGER